MLRALLVGTDSALGNSVAGILAAHDQVRLAGRVDHYPSTFEFGRILRDVEPDVLLISLGSFNQAVELHRLGVQLIPGLQTVGMLRDSASVLPVDAIREGIHEFLEHPVTPAQFDGLLRRVTTLVASRPPQQSETDMAFAFFPARPGLGASTIAVNTAAALAEVPDLNVLLADFDLHNGVLRLLLNLQDGCSLPEAAMRCGALDDNGWRQFVHRLGWLDIARAGKPLPDVRLEPIQVASLMRFARRRYRVLCADLPGTLDPASMVVLRESSKIFLVSTPEPMSLYMAREDMQMLDQLGLGHRVSLVLNRFSSKSGREPEDAAHTVGAPLAAVVPNDYRAVQYAFRVGQPMAANSPGGAAIRDFARTLLSGATRKVSVETPFSLSSLFGLRKSQAS
jgi:pilus assembly protein CpaE